MMRDALITADARKVSGADFFNAVFPRRDQYAARVELLRGWGREAEADALEAAVAKLRAVKWSGQ